jgi:hypothetical protein
VHPLRGIKHDLDCESNGEDGGECHVAMSYPMVTFGASAEDQATVAESDRPTF